MRLRPTRLATVALVALSTACATGRSRLHPSLNVLTRDQMMKGHFVTVYDAVAALRSNWLNVRPNTLIGTQENVVVYYDVARLGNPSELRNIRVTDVEYVEHLSPIEATERYGIGHSQGAILVSSHPR